MTTLLEKIGQPGANHGRLTEEVIRDSLLLGQLIEGLGSETARVKFGCAKVIRLVIRKHKD